MKPAAALLAVAMGASCAHPAARPDVQPPDLQASLDARLAAADALAARGCYLCLRDAAEPYAAAMQISASPAVVRKALENDLMIAIREFELRLPDSGAGRRARLLGESATENYDDYFEALAVASAPIVDGGRTFAEIQRDRADRRNLAIRLEANWPASPMAAYFYIATAISAAEIPRLQPQLSVIADTYSHELSVKYRLQTFGPAFSDADSTALVSAEPRFAEVHFLRGQRAILNANLVAAHRELTAAHDTLPASAAISRTLANVEMSFAHYLPALDLYDQVLSAGADDAAQLGRAVALSYLKMHREALVVLAELLKNPQSNPGDKHYWSAWNYLQLSESQPAYDEAREAMQSMANSDVYRLGGIASYRLARPDEARSYFESSLKMNAADCDSLRYLGLLDSAERAWPSAAARFTSASTCYRRLIDKLSAEADQKRADTSGLLAGQIATLESDISEAKSLLEQTSHNAEVSARNAAR